MASGVYNRGGVAAVAIPRRLTHFGTIFNHGCKMNDKMRNDDLAAIGVAIRTARREEALAVAEVGRLTERLALAQEAVRSAQNRIAVLHHDLRDRAEKG
jgi:hypothetical protein